MRLLLVCLAFWGQLAPKAPENPSRDSQPLEKSPYFAYVDREYIFTIEVVEPGIPLLNFVCMSDNENRLIAKDVRFELGNRKSAGKMFVIDTADPKQPMMVSSIAVHVRSSFGFRIEGDFEKAKELYGVTIRLGAEDFKLVPLTSPNFENLVLKVNRINLGSPDFSDDWQVLKLESMGSRSAARK